MLSNLSYLVFSSMLSDITEKGSSGIYQICCSQWAKSKEERLSISYSINTGKLYSLYDRKLNDRVEIMCGDITASLQAPRAIEIYTNFVQQYLYLYWFKNWYMFIIIYYKNIDNYCKRELLELTVISWQVICKSIYKVRSANIRDIYLMKLSF